MRRGRSFSSGLVVLLGALTGCDGGPPAGEAVADYREPSVTEVNGWTLIESPDPTEHLIVYDDPPTKGVQLLFMRRRTATPLRGGGSAWPDADGARVLVFDDRGVVARVAQGALENQRNLTQPVSVAIDGEALIAVEADGAGLRFVGDEPQGWVTFADDAPVLGGGKGPMAAARGIYEFHLAPVRSKDPLLWVRSGETGEMRPVGSVTRPSDPFLGKLVNTGWVSAADDGSVVFASTVRPELIAFDARGDTAWVTRWQPTAPVAPPAMEVVDGSVTPVFSVLQYGLVTGPDGLLYVLAAVTPGDGPNHILVFDRDGRFIRSGAIPGEEDAIFADKRGRLYSIPAEDALARTGEPERAAFPEFDLPTLGHAGRTTLEAHRGKVVIVNFWASWCGPCRREMPLLDRFAQELDPDQAVVVGLNEDVDSGDALDFIEEIGGVSYAHGEGGGRLRARYNYRGLPYTVVLDRDLRVIRGFYGFGSSIDPIKDIVEKELAAGTDT